LFFSFQVFIKISSFTYITSSNTVADDVTHQVTHSTVNTNLVTDLFQCFCQRTWQDWMRFCCLFGKGLYFWLPCNI